MYTVTKLYAVYNHRIDIFDIEQKTPAEFQSLIGLNTRLYIALQSTTEVVGINYGRLIKDTSIAHCTTWQEVAAQMTDEFVLGYSETVPGYDVGSSNPSHPVVVWDAMRTLNTFDITYASADSGVAGLYAFRWNLHDLEIRLKDDVEDHPNLANCLPVVNGFVCFPEWGRKAGSLYARGGATLCRQEGTRATPEVQLLDFTEVGGFKTCRLEKGTVGESILPYQARIFFNNETNKMNLNSKWIIETDYSLNEYTPILVLCGVPIFSDELEYINQTAFSVDVNKIPLNKAIALRMYYEDFTFSSAENSYVSDTLGDYISAGLGGTTRLENGCFVLMIPTPKLYIQRKLVDVWENNVTLNLKEIEGILIQEKTHLILHYHVTHYDRYKELVTQNYDKVQIIDHLFHQQQVAHIPADCTHWDGEDLQRTNYSMLHITR